MRRLILHVDMDAFFASAEILDEPRLAGRPVIVGGSPTGRGVVTSPCYRARALGVRSAMPAARARRMAPTAVFRKSRMARYLELSRQVFAVFRDFAPVVEGLSVDEAFLDLSRTPWSARPPEEAGREIRRRVQAEVGLPASVGVAENKFLAKLASGLEKPRGLVVIRPGEVETRLAPLPVEAIYGVGVVAARKLRALGVPTIAAVRATSVSMLKAAVGGFAPRLKALARGEDPRPLRPGRRSRSIGAERTFSRDVRDPAELSRRVGELADRVAIRLQKKRLHARTVVLKARFPDFTTRTRTATLGAATDDAAAVAATARALLRDRLERRGRPLRLVGVAVTNLREPGGEQLRLF